MNVVVDTVLQVEARGNDTAYEALDRLAPSHRLNVSEYSRLEAGVVGSSLACFVHMSGSLAVLTLQEGKNMYVVSIIPQAMAWEVAHPSVLLCGSRRKQLDREAGPPYKETKHEYPHEAGFEWMTHVFEANLWIASGYTRSQFHYDKEWNVNCLLSGKKRWFFLNSSQVCNIAEIVCYVSRALSFIFLPPPVRALGPQEFGTASKTFFFSDDLRILAVVYLEINLLIKSRDGKCW